MLSLRCKHKQIVIKTDSASPEVDDDFPTLAAMNFSCCYKPIGNFRSGITVSLIVFKDSSAKRDFLRHKSHCSQQRTRVPLAVSLTLEKTRRRTPVLSDASVTDVNKRRGIYRAHVSTILGRFSTKTYPRH